MDKEAIIHCLSTGAEELGTLLGNTPNTRGLSEAELKRLWLNKVTAAGLSEQQAMAFLNSRLAAEGGEA